MLVTGWLKIESFDNGIEGAEVRPMGLVIVLSEDGAVDVGNIAGTYVCRIDYP
jgi:hypothetical protein